jgi:hypothetical protein
VFVALKCLFHRFYSVADVLTRLFHYSNLHPVVLVLSSLVLFSLFFSLNGKIFLAD